MTAQAAPTSRIPSTLQAIFLASNRGREVNRPPPESAASKVYHGNKKFQKASSLASMLFGGRKRWGRKKNKAMAVGTPETPETSPVAAQEEDKTAEESVHAISPQVHLDLMLRSKGFSTKRHKALQSAYYNKPSALQLASYDVFLIGIIRQDDEESFGKIMSCGISPNPCNKFGTSIAHMVCRRGNNNMLKSLVKSGCNLSIADDYGRTPLHDACWAANPAFDVVKTILEADIRQFHMIDSRGHVPLNYVREEHWGEWNAFLDENKDLFWPDDATNKKDAPPLSLEPINSRSLQDPPNVLEYDVARMVAGGRLTPEEAIFLQQEQEGTLHTLDEEDFSSEDEEYDDDKDDSEFDSDYDSDDDSYGSEDEDDELLNSLPLHVRQQ